MKKSKTKINLGLFGLLMISLSMSQGWADSAGTIESRDLASTTINADDPNLSGGIRPWTVTNARGSSDGKTYTMDFDVQRRKATKTTFVERMENGEIVYDKNVQSGIEATFCSSVRCGDTVFIAIPEEHMNDIQFLKQRISEEANKLAAIHGKEKADADEKRGDLAKRQKEEKECKREIVDENDKSKDEVISKKSKQWFSCKIANLEVDEDEDQYEAFKKELGDELEDLALSNDKDAQDILEDLYDNATNGDIEQYILGMKTANEDYQRAIEMADRGDYSGILRVNNFYTRNPLTGLAPYMAESRQKCRWGGRFCTTSWGRRDSAQIDAFNDIQQDILDQMDIVMNPNRNGLNRRINDGIHTDMNRSCESDGRGCRTRTSYRSMPRMDNSGLNNRGVGRGTAGGQNINGQWVSNQNMDLYNRGNYRGRNNNNFQRNNNQRMPYPNNQAQNYNRRR